MYVRLCHSVPIVTIWLLHPTKKRCLQKNQQKNSFFFIFQKHICIEKSTNIAIFVFLKFSNFQTCEELYKVLYK